jgi:hypothetical protein
MSELAEGARLEIACTTNSGTEGSNPSLSANNTGNSNYGFHLAGPRGLFLKAAKNCFILLNGSVAAKFVIGQPQRRAPVPTEAFSACSEPLFKATGVFDKLW